MRPLHLTRRTGDPDGADVTDNPTALMSERSCSVGDIIVRLAILRDDRGPARATATSAATTSKHPAATIAKLPTRAVAATAAAQPPPTRRPLYQYVPLRE